MNGFINFYKPSGISSAYAINRIKKLFKGTKVGHMGTLDPLAEGVLPLAIGKSTRLFDYLLQKDKIYIAEFTFGYETDTLDRGGKVIKEGGRLPTKEEVLSVIPKLIGIVDQVPPIFSAKNVNGQRSYDLARNGVAVELKPKQVEINSITLLDSAENSFTFEIVCKGGTYIRSICRDMAACLGTFGTMTKLKRTKSGCFDLTTAITEEQLKNTLNIEELLIKPDSVLTLDCVTLSKSQSIEMYNGRACVVELCDGSYKIYDNNGIFVGVGLIENKLLKIKAYIKDWWKRLFHTAKALMKT